MREFWGYHFQLLILLVFGFSLAGCGEKPQPDELHYQTAGADQFNSDVSSSFVVNGEFVEASDWVSRSVVAVLWLEDKKIRGVCSGTLIAPNVVLTAAHCVDGFKSLSLAFTQNFSRLRPEMVRAVETRRLHPLWQTNKTKNTSRGFARGDIALVTFHGATPPEYEPAALIPQSVGLTAGLVVEVAGFGVTTPGASIQTAIKLHKAFSRIHGRYDSNTWLLDGSKSSTCYGDSGGPAFIHYKGKTYVWGVTNAELGRCARLMVHADIRAFQPWLSDQIRELQNKAQMAEDVSGEGR